MPKDNKTSLKDLEKRLDLLLKRFYEQKGIIDSYIKRESDWKKGKVLHRKEISRLEKDLNKAKNEYSSRGIVKTLWQRFNNSLPSKRKKQPY